MKQGGEAVPSTANSAGGYRILRIFVREQTHKKKMDGKRKRKAFAGRFVYIRVELPATWNRKTRRWNHARRDLYLGPASVSQGGENPRARAGARGSSSGWRNGVEKGDDSDERTLEEVEHEVDAAAAAESESENPDHDIEDHAYWSGRKRRR